MRLIDAETLFEKVGNIKPKNKLEYELLGKFMNMISNSPTVDRPHGEWLSHYEYCKKHDLIPSGLIAFWWCNKCEQGVEIQTNFCPNCGADMRKEGS